MKLKNYTSGVPVSRTMARIEELLIEVGAKAMSKTIENGEVTAITFQLSVDFKDVLIRLSANPEAVYAALADEIVKPRDGTLERIREQAVRTAWKIQQDWLEIELTKLRLKQTEPLQAFLPYLWDGRQTFYQLAQKHGFRGLLPAKTESSNSRERDSD